MFYEFFSTQFFFTPYGSGRRGAKRLRGLGMTRPQPVGSRHVLAPGTQVPKRGIYKKEWHETPEKFPALFEILAIVSLFAFMRVYTLPANLVGLFLVHSLIMI